MADNIAMVLTKRDESILDALCNIGRGNISTKEIADGLGISYSYLMRRKAEIAHNNGYATSLGLIIDYARERERKRLQENSKIDA